MVALVLSITGGALHVLLRLVAAPWEARTLSIAAIGLGYGLYLVWRSPIAAGRISLVLLWAVVSVPVLLLAPHWTLPVQLALLWLTRALFWQQGIGAALADLLLIVVGLGGGLWALTATGSLAAALWTFFLVQAPFLAAGSLVSAAPPPSTADTNDEDHFERAERSASASLHRLAQRGGPFETRVGGRPQAGE
jgi:hypothetical protein